VKLHRALVSVPLGTLGAATTSIDRRSWMLIGIRWDNGSKLGLAVPPDRYEVVND
jgi:hypothetical protein